MTIDNWVNLVEAFIASLAFTIVVVQLWFGLRILKTNLISRLYSELHEIHQAFIEYPMLRPYFYHKKPLVLDESGDPTKEDLESYYRARAIAEMFYDAFEHIYVVRGEVTYKIVSVIGFPGSDVAENMDNYIDDMIASSQFLSSYLCEVRSNIHPKALRKFLINRIKYHWPNIPSAARSTPN